MSIQMQVSSLDKYKARLSRLLQALESQDVPLNSSLEESLTLACNQLELVLEKIPQSSESGQNLPFHEPINLQANGSSLSFAQPVQEILNCIPDSHIVTSSDGIIHMANQQAARLFQLTQQQLLGRSLSNMMSEDNWSNLLQRLQALNGHVQNWQGEFQVFPYSQSPRSVVCTLSALRDTDGQLVGAHWLLWDVTEHRHGIIAQEFSNELIQLLLSGMTVRQALFILCRRLVETFGYPLVWIGTKEAEGSMCSFAHDGNSCVTSLQRLERLNDPGELLSVVNQAIQQKTTQLLKRDDTSDLQGVQWLRTQGFHSQIVVPLSIDGRVLGVLTICSYHPGEFEPSIVSWLEQLGLHISKAMFVSQNYDHLRLQGKALNSAEHAVCITNPAGRIEWVNDAYCRMSGYEVAEVIGTVLPSSQSKPFRLLLKRAAKQELPAQSWKVESTATRKNGREYTVEEVLTPLLNEDGHVSNIVAILQDITSRKEAETQIIHRVYHDPLTDLPNRVMFQDRLEQALAQARRHQRLLAVFFIDLDCFKRVNDEYGHRAGDQLLKTVAERLAHCVRATDTVARLSGDEFTLILQDLEHADDAQHVAQKILDCVVVPISIDDHMIQVRTSIGIALFPVDAVEPEDLLRQADRAMYKAKELGGQAWAFSSGGARSCVPDVS
ncbi:diguanylate cyclase domain-containing protein [Candidatus Nitrospira salsa]